MPGHMSFLKPITHHLLRRLKEGFQGSHQNRVNAGLQTRNRVNAELQTRNRVNAELQTRNRVNAELQTRNSERGTA